MILLRSVYNLYFASLYYALISDVFICTIQKPAIEVDFFFEIVQYDLQHL
jgi:hypothetical protein